MNAAVQPAPLPASPSETAVKLTPSFLGALRGIWSFTWKSQLTWGRATNYLLGLLALPCVVYFTTWSAEKWRQRPIGVGDVSAAIQQFTEHLTRARQKLRPEQAKQARSIFLEEFMAAYNQPKTGNETEDLAPGQEAMAKACYDRIGVRLQPILNERQNEEYKHFQRNSLQALKTVSQPWKKQTRSSPYYHWLIDFYFFVILPLHCVATCGSLIREELQADTLSFLTTRPVSRARLLLAKYLSQTAWLQIILLLETLLFFAAGALRGVQGVSSLAGLFLAVQVLAVIAWSALGTFFGLVTRRYMALALVYGFIVELGIGRIPTNINTLSLMRHLKTLLSRNAALESIFDWSAGSLPVALGALVVAPVFFVAVAAALFSLREYHHTAEMQK